MSFSAVRTSFTHRAARVVVRPLVGGPVTPNHLTSLRLLTGLAACAAIGVGEHRWQMWGAALWVVSAFLDRADGELARLGGATTAWGHAYDYVCDVGVSALFFVGAGVGLRHSPLGDWAIGFGIVAGAAVAAASLLSEALERRSATGNKAYGGIGAFDFDDVFYLFAPVVWVGWLYPFLIAAIVGAPLFALVTWIRLQRST